MLIPKFTIRQLMLATVAAAFVCAILGFAARGNAFAYGLGISILGTVIPLAACAFAYWTLLSVTKPSRPAHVPSSVKSGNRELQPAESQSDVES